MAAAAVVEEAAVVVVVVEVMVAAEEGDKDNPLTSQSIVTLMEPPDIRVCDARNLRKDISTKQLFKIKWEDQQKIVNDSYLVISGEHAIVVRFTSTS